MYKLLEKNLVRRLVAPLATRIRRAPGLLAATRWAKSRILGSGKTWEVSSIEVDSQHQVDFRAMLPEHFSDEIGFVCYENDPIVPYFFRAAEMLGIAGRVIDPSRDDFHATILSGSERIFLCRPAHFTNQERQMSWEKTQPLYDDPGYSVFPPRNSLRIYEAKRELAYFLKMTGIPHPETHVFYDIEEALDFA